MHRARMPTLARARRGLLTILAPRHPRARRRRSPRRSRAAGLRVEPPLAAASRSRADTQIYARRYDRRDGPVVPRSPTWPFSADRSCRTAGRIRSSRRSSRVPVLHGPHVGNFARRLCGAGDGRGGACAVGGRGRARRGGGAPDRGSGRARSAWRARPSPASRASPARSTARSTRSRPISRRSASRMTLPRAPEFWWRRRSLAGYALAPLGALYGRVSGAPHGGAGRPVGVPVICVGNLVVGGAGKTPTALEVASVCRGARPPARLPDARLWRARARAGPRVAPPRTRRARSATSRCCSPLHAPTVVSADRAERRAAARQPRRRRDRHGRRLPEPVARQGPVARRGRCRRAGSATVASFPAGPLRAPLAGADPPRRRVVVLRRGAGRRRRARTPRAPACRAAGAARAGAPARLAATALPRLCRHRRPGEVLCHAGRRRAPRSAHDGLSRPPLVQRRGMRSESWRRRSAASSCRSPPRRTACGCSAATARSSASRGGGDVSRSACASRSRGGWRR